MESGLGRPQVTALLALRQDAERVWGQFALASGTDAEFDRVFGESCRKFNSPELWSLEMFRDELIGDLLQALPHPSWTMTGGCWSWIEERNRRHHFGEPEPVVVPPSVRDSGTGQSGAPVSRIRPEVPEISAPDTEPEQHCAARPENAVSDTDHTEKCGLPSPRSVQTRRLLLLRKSCVRRYSRICTVASRFSVVMRWKRVLPDPLCHPL